jgi:rod shape-determining protein MreC
MNAITATRRTIRREWTAFGALLIISVGMMGVSDTRTAQDLQSVVSSTLRPVETFVNDVADTAGSYWSALTQIDRLRSQIEELNQENLTLQEQLDRMGAISKLNDDWTKITSAAAGVPYQTTPVRVIVRDISNVGQRTLIVNKGSDDGMVAGQVVIDAGGALVGRIQTVTANVSTILLISDPSSVVVGKEVKSGATGTIHGTVSGGLQMQYIDVAATLTKGDFVFTAGEALPGTSDRSPYPPGLLIGTITEVSKVANAVVQSATITPAAHLTDATFLLVIIDYRGGFGALPSGCLANPASSGSPTPSPKPGATSASGGSGGPGSSGSPGTTCPPGSSKASPSPSSQPTAKPSPALSAGY